MGNVINLFDQHKRHVDLLHVLGVQQLFRKADSFANDPDERDLCKYCTYVDTTRSAYHNVLSTCKICGKEMINNSFDVDYCCEECAKQHGICKHCGGTMD